MSEGQQVIVGTEEIVMTLRFNIPSGVSAEQMKYKLAETVQVSVGMLAVLRETNYEVRRRGDTPKLVT